MFRGVTGFGSVTLALLDKKTRAGPRDEWPRRESSSLIVPTNGVPNVIGKWEAIRQFKGERFEN